MAVKPTTSPTEQATLDQDLLTLLGCIRPVIAALKHAGPPPAIFHDAFERGSLGPRHMPVLLSVSLAGRLSVSDIAERVGLGLSTTSMLVGELSRAGLVERSEDPSDRRRTLVMLSETYREPAEAFLQTRLVPFRRTLERLSPRQRAAFLEGWRILAEETAVLRDGPGPAQDG